MTKKELAIAYHDKKFNCAQAVACAFAKEVGADEKTLFRAAEGLGLGMGGMEGTCGALSGAILLAGMKNSDGNTEDPGTKASTYQLSKQMVTCFQKGIESGKVLCSCPDCICHGVEVVEQVLGL